MSVLRLLESIVCAPTSGLDAASVRRQFGVLSRVRSWLDAREAELTARLLELAPGSAGAIASLDISTSGRKTKQETRQLMGRAEALREMPGFADALREGTITSAHVNEVATALRRAGQAAPQLKEHEGALVLSAKRLPHDQFSRQLSGLVNRLNASSTQDESDRQRRSTHLSAWTDGNGMIHLRGAFDAERGSVLLGRLDNMMERLFHAGHAAADSDLSGVSANDNLRAVALLDLCAAGAAGGGPAGVADIASAGEAARAEIIVTVDLETLRNGLHEHGVCRTSRGVDLPVEAVRRLACRAEIIPAVMDSNGVPVDVGRRNRLATARQRRLIFAMYRSCAVPECDVGVAHCAPHHIDYWERGGRTDLDNLVPLCSRHHHAAHEGGWRLDLAADRTLTVTLPDGRVMSRPLDRNLGARNPGRA